MPTSAASSHGARLSRWNVLVCRFRTQICTPFMTFLPTCGVNMATKREIPYIGTKVRVLKGIRNFMDKGDLFEVVAVRIAGVSDRSGEYGTGETVLVLCPIRSLRVPPSHRVCIHVRHYNRLFDNGGFNARRWGDTARFELLSDEVAKVG